MGAPSQFEDAPGRGLLQQRGWPGCIRYPLQLCAIAEYYFGQIFEAKHEPGTVA